MIKTKYIPATDTTGSKIRATCNGRQVSVPYPYELSGEAVHLFAAVEWCLRHKRQIIGAGRYNERTKGYVFPIDCP